MAPASPRANKYSILRRLRGYARTTTRAFTTPGYGSGLELLISQATVFLWRPYSLFGILPKILQRAMFESTSPSGNTLLDSKALSI